MENFNDNLNEYVLLHKNRIVIKFNIYNNNFIMGNGEIIDYNYVPPLIKTNEKKFIKENYMNAWLVNRSMRLDRLHYDKLVNLLKLNDGILNKVDEKSLVIKTNALSLNDCYWIKSTSSNLKWEDVNFFNNDFDVAINKLYCDTLREHQIYNFVGTPNNTTQGQLRKVWEIDENGKRILIKKTDGMSITDVINEKVVSDYLDLTNTKHIKYNICDKYNGKCSVCKNICNENIEFISFNDYLASNYNNNKNDKDNIIDLVNNICKEYDIRSNFESMILIDILFGNTDRHWGNLGILRDSNTLKIIDAMPIFDNGFTMLGHESDEYINIINTDKLARFSKIDGRTLFDTFDYLTDKYDKRIIENLDKTIEIMEKVYKEYGISEKRINYVKEFLVTNISEINKYI